MYRSKAKSVLPHSQQNKQNQTTEGQMGAPLQSRVGGTSASTHIQTKTTALLPLPTEEQRSSKTSMSGTSLTALRPQAGASAILERLTREVCTYHLPLAEVVSELTDRPVGDARALID